MSLINRIRCIANGHRFSAPQQQECWWVIECQCCGASRTADSVLEFLLGPVALCDASKVAVDAAETFQRTVPSDEPTSSAPLFPSQSLQARPV